MNGDDLILLILGAIAGGFINGLAGFGTALFALGFFLNFMRPVEAVAVVVVLSVVSGLQGVWLVRREILEHRIRLSRFLIPAFVGIPFGVAALTLLDAGVLKLSIAGFLILYGGYFSLRRTLPQMDKPTHVADAVVGFLGGFLGGAASLSGALPTMWCSLKPWPKAVTRAILQPFNVAVLGVTAVLLWARGVYTPDVLTMAAIALPVAILSARVGIYVFGRLSDDMFRRLLIGLTFVSGAIIALRELL